MYVIHNISIIEFMYFSIDNEQILKKYKKIN